MKIHSKHNKATPGWGYWGNYGEIDMGFSSGLIDNNAEYSGEPVHYHKQATTYILVLEGSGFVEINGEKITVAQDELLEIAPGEHYRMLGADQMPFRWITISSNKNPDDKVVIS